MSRLKLLDFSPWGKIAHSLSWTSWPFVCLIEKMGRILWVVILVLFLGLFSTNYKTYVSSICHIWTQTMSYWLRLQTKSIEFLKLSIYYQLVRHKKIYVVLYREQATYIKYKIRQKLNKVLITQGPNHNWTQLNKVISHSLGINYIDPLLSIRYIDVIKDIWGQDKCENS